MKINEIFESIQGEGKYAGTPALFIRTSGCTRTCSFCDTKYHINGKEKTVKDLYDIIKDSKKEVVVWTGGEPLLQVEEINQLKAQLGEYPHFHLESNGDLCERALDSTFDYIDFSPKSKQTADKIKEYSWKNYDVKVVTDLKLNKILIPYATILMPLSVDFDGPIDKEIKQKVWKYCAEHNIRYTPRLHVDVFGQKKGI
jgi:organic radical activating enzyme